MIDIRPFKQEDFAVLPELANQAAPFAPQENAVWFEARKTFDETKRIRRHYIATENHQAVGYGCLEQQHDNSKWLRIYVVCSPMNMRGEVGKRLYSRLMQEAEKLEATILWARELQADESSSQFFSSRGFKAGQPYTIPNHAPLIDYKLDLQRQ